jgi:hypothetical protein
MSDTQKKSKRGFCQKCGGHIISFSRKDDWKVRKLHKKCWKALEFDYYDDGMLYHSHKTGSPLKHPREYGK